MTPVSLQLLQTKLYIPAIRPALVARPQLFQQLEATLHVKLTLVSAPAGFGKTTLIASWLNAIANETQATWYTIDQNDNQPIQFFTYFVAALQQRNSSIGHTAREMLGADEVRDFNPILTSLINELAQIQQTIILVLDDYHLIDEPAIHEALLFFIEHAPPHLHLVIGSRSDPPFLLARLRARNELVEVRQADLRFQISETDQFLNNLMTLNLPADAVQALGGQTEGWIAGLQMAGLSLQAGRDVTRFIEQFSQSNKYIFDYLAEEVWLGLSDQTQSFLLHSAPLNRLSVPLCAAIWQQEESVVRNQLIQLERDNLFLIPLDEGRNWYRYHQLFANLIRQMMQRDQPTLLRQVHQRASEWFMQSGNIDEAIHHALAAPDFERATMLLTNQSTDWIQDGELSTLLHWVEQLPERWRSSSPQLTLNHAWATLFRGSVAKFEQLLAQIPANVALSSPFDAYVATLRSTLAIRQGEPDQAIALANKALEQLNQPDPSVIDSGMRGAAAVSLAYGYDQLAMLPQASTAYESAVGFNLQIGNVVATLNAYRGWSNLLVQQADLAQAEHIIRYALQDGVAQLERSKRRPSQSSLAPLRVSLAELLYEWNQLGEAEKLLQPAVLLLAAGGPVNLSDGLLVLAKVRLAQGDLDEAKAIAVQLSAKLENSPSQYSQAQLQQRVLRLECLLFAHEMSEQRRQRLQQLLRSQPASIATARAQLALGEFARARTTLRELLAVAESEGRHGVWLELACLLCVVLVGQDEIEVATTWLEQALPIAEPAGYQRLFTDLGHPMQMLLKTITAKDEKATFARRLLWPTPMDTNPSSSTTSTENPLSARETEVLKLIARGLSNKAIAAELLIAPSTAKRHTVNIYNKLDVANRAEATAKAFHLGLA